MKSPERVAIALGRGQPDRIPIIEFVIDPNVARAAVPGCTDTSDCKDKLGMDSVGCGVVFERTCENDDGTYTDEWGVTYIENAEVVAHPVRGPIETMADLRAYQPPDPDAPHRLGELADVVARYKGKRSIVFHQRAAFMWAAYLNGLDNLLANFLLEPVFTAALLDMVLEVHLAVARNAIRAGVEVIVLGDDYAHNGGPMMSPDAFDHFIAPRLKRMVDVIHEEGGLVIKHTDGNIYSLLESIAACGPDAINPIEPVAGMDLATTKRLVGDRMALVGNVDCGHLLSHGTADDVRETVQKCIADAGPGGGFVLSSSNSIHSSVKPENLIAMVEAGLEFGSYPLG